MPVSLDRLDATLLATAAEWFGGSVSLDNDSWSVRNRLGVRMTIETDGDEFVFRDIVTPYWPERWEYVRTPDADVLLRCVLYRAAFWYRKRSGMRFLALPDIGYDDASGWQVSGVARRSPTVLEKETAAGAATAAFAVERDARIFTRYAALPLADLITSLVNSEGLPLFGPASPGHPPSQLPGRLARLSPERLDKAVRWAATAEPLIRDGLWLFHDKKGQKTSITATDNGYILDFELPFRANADRKQAYVRTRDADILTRCLLFLCGGADRFLDAANSPLRALPYSDRYGCRVEDPDKPYPVTVIGTSEESEFSAFFPASSGARRLTYYAGAPIEELLASIESVDGAPLFTPVRLALGRCGNAAPPDQSGTTS